MKEIIEEFEYKGINIKVCKDEEENVSFNYKNEDGEHSISLEGIQKFIESPFEHYSIGDATLDKIQKSIKFNCLIVDEKDLLAKLEKYKQF